MSATLALFPAGHPPPAVRTTQQHARAVRVKYRIEVAGCTNPWADSMRPYMAKLLGSDTLGRQTLELLTAAYAPSTCDTYGSAIRQYFRFCDEEQRPPLAASPATMARYVRWLGNLGTIKESSLQPYLSAVNSFFEDHGCEPCALGSLITKVRKGLAASQVTLTPGLMRAYLPARVAHKALTLAQTLKAELGPTWAADPGTATRVQLFRACIAVVVLFLFFCRGGAGVECLSGDLVVSPEGGILLYHRVRKGQRGADADKKLLCQLPAAARGDVADLLRYFDGARQVYAGGRMPVARWAIGHKEQHAKWTADTLTTWLQQVLAAVNEQPPAGFAWTSHSLRKGATTAAYVIGVTMIKIKYYGGWSHESNVVLDYIDPTVLPCPADWHFIGRLTPWGGQPALVPRRMAT